MIELFQISKSFGTQVVLNEFSNKFTAEKTHILLGRSGCGKSTILRLIIGLEKANAGEISVDGKNNHEIKNSELPKYFGYVIQDKTLMPHMNAFDNIMLPARALKIEYETVKERFNYLEDLVQFDKGLTEKYPSQLSGGQKQKACLIRALILDPPYLLMDEPFSALDPMIRSALQNELKKIFQKVKKTVIFVTHDLNEASALGDEIVLLNQGNIEQKGAMRDLKENPASEFVKTFFQAQAQHF